MPPSRSPRCSRGSTLDDGHDPKKFETSLLRDRLRRAAVMSELAGELQAVQDGLDDTTLHLGDLSRPVMLSAYDIAKTQAKHDGAIAKAAKPAMDFYAHVGRIAAATKRKNKKA